jgi:hypothetical protein
MEQRFLELAQNKDISDQDLLDELDYVYATTRCIGIPDRTQFIKRLREETQKLDMSTIKHGALNEWFNPFFHEHIQNQYTVSRYALEKYDIKKRIQSLEQTLASFMEQTKAEHLSQEATIQSLSKEMDEFQEEFYDCQSELKEHVGLLENALQEAVENVLELHHLRDERDYLKYKMA